MARFNRFFSLLLMILLLAGCVQLEIDYELYNYGFEVRHFISQEEESPEGRALMEEILKFWQDQGFRPQSGIRQNQVGARKTVSANGISESAALLDQYLADESPFAPAVFDYRRGFLWDRFHLDLVLDLREPLDLESLQALSPQEQQAIDGLLGQEAADLRVRITLPGRVTSTNGAVSYQEGRSTVAWPLLMGQTNRLTLKGAKPNPLPIAIVTFAIVLFLFQLAVFLLAKRRRRR